MESIHFFLEIRKIKKKKSTVEWINEVTEKKIDHKTCTLLALNIIDNKKKKRMFDYLIILIAK